MMGPRAGRPGGVSMSSVTDIPGFTAGTWVIDPIHSEIAFSVRHLMVSKVRGRFETFEGEIVTSDDILDTHATVTVDLRSINTGNEDRDNDLRSANYFEVDKYPTMTYRSTSIKAEGDHFVAEGDLTVKGTSPDPWGGTRAGLSATGEINRKDFGLPFDMPMEGGGLVVGDRIKLELEIEAVLQT